MVHAMHEHFVFFAVFKNLKSSFSEDNLPENALDIFIENATKYGLGYPIKRKKWGSNFKAAPKLCIFYTMLRKLQGSVKEWLLCIWAW